MHCIFRVSSYAAVVQAVARTDYEGDSLGEDGTQMHVKLQDHHQTEPLQRTLLTLTISQQNVTFWYHHFEHAHPLHARMTPATQACLTFNMRTHSTV